MQKLEQLLQSEIQSILPEATTTVNPNTIGSEIADIFDKNPIHHLPVVDLNNHPIGMISLGDYRQLQHKFTRQQIGHFERENDKFFNSILAKEIMTANPVCLDEKMPIQMALDVFLENKIHSIIICKGKEFLGIITPIVILKMIVSEMS